MPALDSPLVCPILVGRTDETAELGALRSEVEQGRGRVVLVSGEAGIGKSRFLQSIASAARERDWRVVTAGCYEQDRGLPLGLVTDLVQHLATEFEDVRAPVDPASALARLPGTLHATLGASGPEPADPEQEQRRLFAGIVAALEQATERDACLLLLEDLHWADRASLDFIALLARSVPRLRLLVLATYRGDEVSPNLGQLLAYLDRERLAAELPLRALTLGEVDAMVRASLSDRASLRAGTLQALHRRTDGNPFFVEEVLRSALTELASGGDLDGPRIAEAQVPRSIAEAVMRRVGLVSFDARELLTLAAVVGDRFELPVLEAVCDREPEDLLALLRELASQQLLVEVEDDQFRFPHALTREAVLRQMLARERRVLHARIADAIEALYAKDLDEHAGPLAYHLFGAQRWEGAAVHAQTAGRRAMRMHAPASAAEQFSRAIDATRRLDQVAAPGLYLERARAYDLLGDFDRARTDIETAVGGAETGGDTRLLVDALLELGLLWASRDYGQARGSFDRAVEVARGLDDPPVLAHALNRLGNWYSNTGRYDESRRHLDESLVLARRSGDQRTIAETVDLLGMTCLMAGELRESLDFFLEARDLFTSIEDRRRLASVLASIPVSGGTYQTGMLEPALPLTEAAAHGEMALTVAREAGGSSDVAYALWQLGFCLGPQGQYARALALTSEALEIALHAEHRQWVLASRCVLGALYTDLLQGEQAVEHLEAALTEATELRSHIWAHQAAGLLAGALTLLGRYDDAEALIAGGVQSDDVARGQTLAVSWYRAPEAELAVARADPEHALAILDRHFPQPGPRTMRCRGRALLARGERADGLAALEHALEVARTSGDVSLQWRLQTDLAHARLASGDRTEARAHAAEALALIEGIAGGLLDAALAASFRERATLLLPASLRPRGDAADGAPLSARELEVARLVARGLSNRAIADELVVSVRTVETHVANAMSKLGHTSRSQLAAWVVEHGLQAPVG